MHKRVGQPPICRESRPSERRSYGAGLVAATLGFGLVLVGFGRMTGVETVTGDPAREAEINRAIAHGGVVRIPAPPPSTLTPGIDGPGWPQLDPGSIPPSMTSTSVKPGLKIDLRAKAACPT
jgi:hypothetical protein